MKIHHLGVLCERLEETSTTFQKLGMAVIAETKDDIRKVKLIFLTTETGEILELVSPTSSESVVSDLIKRYNNSVYHVCYISENLENDIEELEKQNFLVLIPPQESIAFNNNRVSFLFHKNTGIIELVEKKYESCLFK